MSEIFFTKANNESVEAIQYQNDNVHDVLAFCGGSGRIQQLTGGGEVLDIKRLDRDRTTYLWRIEFGYWMIKSAIYKESGGFYIISDEEFWSTFDSEIKQEEEV